MKKWMYNALIIIFAAVFVVSAGLLAWYYIDSSVQRNRYEDLSQLRGTQPSRPIPTDPVEGETSPAPTEPTTVEITDPKTGEKRTVLKQFEILYPLNTDLIGWLTIPGTVIDYPVMHAPDRTDYYLHRNFDKDYSQRGCLYIREVCDVFAPTDNITIYGHRMRDGSMFARLDNYMERAYFEQNSYMYFDTLEAQHTYKIMAVFLTTATVGEGFAYHEFVAAANEAEFDAFVNECQRLSLYDTGVDAEFGDKLITLSTCEYSQTNGRLVVVAKRVT